MRPDKGCYPQPEPCEPQMNMCSREGARARLQSLAKAYRQRAHALEKLADEIGHLSPDADEALYEMAMKMGRG